jgi:hypothetical protein
VKRFLKTLLILVASLFLVASGVNVALDRIAHSTSQSSYTAYDERGAVIVVYRGDMTTSKAFAKPTPFIVPTFFHRT